MTTVAYTDGACLGNPGPGGWAWAVEDGPYASGPAEHTTNQRMEIVAALEAVRAIEGPLEIASDSTYVVHCFRDRWWEGWLKRGWRNSKKEPVANRDLWEPFVELVRSRGDVTFRWVKGHAGDPMNDLVDRLAVEAATTQRGRSGTGEPADLGPADKPAARSRAGSATGAGGGDVDELPPGHRILVGGLRPSELGGYDPNPVASAVRDRLSAILRAKQELHGDLIVLSGLGLGAEQLGAEAAGDAGAAYAAVLPYPDPDSIWPEAARRRFRELLDGAVATVTLQGHRPASKQQAGAALDRRDAWMADHADEAIIVWDGAEPRVGRLYRSLVVRLGEEDVWLEEPPA